MRKSKKTLEVTKNYIVGFDLHSNNSMCAIINTEGEKIKTGKLANDIHAVTTFLQPYRERIIAVVVESTYNWYWLVDGLLEQGYDVRLANPAAIVQYEGIKHADDKSDAQFLAELFRLNILPEGYICSNPQRANRDLFRRRIMLVQKRTALLLSLNNLHSRNNGTGIGGDWLKRSTPGKVLTLFSEPGDLVVAEEQKCLIDSLNGSIARLEQSALTQARLLPGFDKLLAIPGIGKILAMTIAFEVIDINRFPSAENFASYCRAVKATRSTNDRKKGENNSKSGNRYLAWAFVEAANFIRSKDPAAQAWYERKRRRTHAVVATKALACKLAKAVWYVLKRGEPFDSTRLFGEKKGKDERPSRSRGEDKGKKKQ